MLQRPTQTRQLPTLATNEVTAMVMKAINSRLLRKLSEVHFMTSIQRDVPYGMYRLPHARLEETKRISVRCDSFMIPHCCGNHPLSSRGITATRGLFPQRYRGDIRLTHPYL